MNQHDVAGLLRTYSEQCSKCTNTKKLHEFIKRLKSDLDLRTIKVECNNKE